MPTLCTHYWPKGQNSWFCCDNQKRNLSELLTIYFSLIFFLDLRFVRIRNEIVIATEKTISKTICYWVFCVLELFELFLVFQLPFDTSCARLAPEELWFRFLYQNKIDWAAILQYNWESNFMEVGSRHWYLIPRQADHNRLR